MIWNHTGKRWQTVPLHGTARGQLAIICGSGPSFAGIDVDRLRGPRRLVIGINTTYPRLRPDFWLGMDEAQTFAPSLVFESFPKIFRGNFGERPCGPRPLRTFPMSLFADITESADFYDWRPEAPFQWTGNTFLVALQFAFWLGCRSIYFLGVDLDSTHGDHFHGDFDDPAIREREALLHRQLLARLARVVARTEEYGCAFMSGSESSKINALMPFFPVEHVLEKLDGSIRPSAR